MKNLKHGRLPDLVENLDWYALLVPPQKEFAAQDVLKRLGIVSFCPFESLWRHKNKYSKEKELRHFPIMPRYVFAGFSDAPPWYSLFQLPIIASVVGLSGNPATIHGMPDLIRRFRNGLKRPDHEKHMRTHREYAAGDLAVIVDSAMSGRVVHVTSIENGHAFFTLEMFGAQMTLSLPTEKLEAA